ncbi:hypothetical protein CHU98_g9886 [Xylaria longipes]|nr:hypothetical protein CHU98_g9886 [Xylaria longipes]
MVHATCGFKQGEAILPRDSTNDGSSGEEPEGVVINEIVLEGDWRARPNRSHVASPPLDRLETNVGVLLGRVTVVCIPVSALRQFAAGPGEKTRRAPDWQKIGSLLPAARLTNVLLVAATAAELPITAQSPSHGASSLQRTSPLSNSDAAIGRQAALPPSCVVGRDICHINGGKQTASKWFLNWPKRGGKSRPTGS